MSVCIKIALLLLHAAVVATARTGLITTTWASASSSMTPMRAVVVVNGLWDLRAICWQLSWLYTAQKSDDYDKFCFCVADLACCLNIGHLNIGYI